MERITEIAIFIHDGNKIVDEYQTLINPECNIPYFITGLTGITNEMVADAPKFFEVAKKIVELTEGNIFVAHNARFDYSFIRQEFKNLGYSYSRKILDTVALSRRLLPGHRSYSLGNLCSDLGISINGRHRAAGDALATVKLFELLLEAEETSEEPVIGHRKGNAQLNPGLDESILEKTPDAPGVYYFYNAVGKLIYIGKSNNIRKRIMTHLSNNRSRRAMEMRDEITDITWEETGSELIALLLESEEIKNNKPKYNRAQRRSGFTWGIYYSENESGYICLGIKAIGGNKGLLSAFTSKDKALDTLKRLIEKHELCQKLCGLYESTGSCFHHQVGLCRGACNGSEVAAAYNMRARMAMNDFVFSQENFFIIDSGRNSDEKSAVKIVNGKYQGYGYFDINNVGFGLSAIHDCIKPAPDNRDIQVIVKGYMKKNSFERIIKF